MVIVSLKIKIIIYYYNSLLSIIIIKMTNTTVQESLGLAGPRWVSRWRRSSTRSSGGTAPTSATPGPAS